MPFASLLEADDEGADEDKWGGTTRRWGSWEPLIACHRESARADTAPGRAPG